MGSYLINESRFSIFGNWRFRSCIFTYSDEDNSTVQTASGTATSVVTGGTVITGGFLESGGNAGGRAGVESSGVQNAIRLGAAIDGTVNTIVLCVRPINGSTGIDIEGGISWRELS